MTVLPRIARPTLPERQSRTHIDRPCGRPMSADLVAPNGFAAIPTALDPPHVRLTTFAPILISFSFKLVNDQFLIGSGFARVCASNCRDGACLGGAVAPPVITADNSSPTKIIPATAGDPQSSKGVQDRLATGEKEQLVSKQEEPVTLKDLGAQAAAPRPALPAPPVQAGSAAQPSGAANGSSEPKKVRTVTIRPDGTDVSGRPVGVPPPAASTPGTAGTTASPRTATTPLPPTLPACRSC